MSDPENGIHPAEFMAGTEKARSATYMIECLRNGYDDLRLWWRPERAGYTKFVDQAGLYSYDETRKITDADHWGDDRPWTTTAVADRAMQVVMR